MSFEIKVTITTAVAKEVINIDNGKVYPSLRKAAESVGGQYRGLLQSLKKGRTYKKTRFAYLKKE